MIRLLFFVPLEIVQARQSRLFLNSSFNH